MAKIVESIDISVVPKRSSRTWPIPRISPNGRAASCRQAGRAMTHWSWAREPW
jgi:hypothetical protein